MQVIKKLLTKKLQAMVNNTYMLAITKANEYHLTGSYAINKYYIKLIHVGFISFFQLMYKI